MAPRLSPGNVIVAFKARKRLKPGDVVIAYYKGREIIKRVERAEPNRVFLIGDNLSSSTDSRHFGWLQRREVVGKVLWPNVHN